MTLSDLKSGTWGNQFFFLAYLYTTCSYRLTNRDQLRRGITYVGRGVLRGIGACSHGITPKGPSAPNFGNPNIRPDHTTWSKFQILQNDQTRWRATFDRILHRSGAASVDQKYIAAIQFGGTGHYNILLLWLLLYTPILTPFDGDECWRDLSAVADLRKFVFPSFWHTFITRPRTRVSKLLDSVICWASE